MPSSPKIEIPVVETPRLRLRGHTADDFENVAAMWADPAVVRYIGGKPRTREEIWAKLMTMAGHWALVGYGYWLIEEKESRRFVGEAGLGDFKREIEPSFDRAPEAGWALSPAAQGKGLATEAVSAIVAWHDTNRGRARLVCMIDPANLPSLRVAAKCGFHEYARTTYKGESSVLLERRAAPGEARP